MSRLLRAVLFSTVVVMGAHSAWADVACAQGVWGYKILIVAHATEAFGASAVYAKACGAYRRPALRKFVGYLFGQVPMGIDASGQAVPMCNDFRGNAMNMNFLLWDETNGKSVRTENFEFRRINLFGDSRNHTLVEACFDFCYTDEPGMAYGAPQLILAGFGHWGEVSNGMTTVRDLQGKFAGQILSYAVDGGEDVCGDPLPETWTPSAYWSICYEQSSNPEITDDALTTACGKWKMVWDEALVSRLTENGLSPYVARPSAQYEPHPDFASEDW